jgi:hypothetical protein
MKVEQGTIDVQLRNNKLMTGTLKMNIFIYLSHFHDKLQHMP